MRKSRWSMLDGKTDVTEGLRTFRRGLHACFARRADALF